MNAIGTITITRHLVSETCCVCGSLFGLESNHMRALKESGERFYCPNGHAQSYNGLLRKERKRHASIESDLRHLLEQAKADRDAFKFQARAEKSAKTRLKKRAENGVCPCCKRSFQNLRRHMKSKHANFLKN